MPALPVGVDSPVRGFFGPFAIGRQVESYGQDQPRHAAFSPVKSLLAKGFWITARITAC